MHVQNRPLFRPFASRTPSGPDTRSVHCFGHVRVGIPPGDRSVTGRLRTDVVANQQLGKSRDVVVAPACQAFGDGGVPATQTATVRHVLVHLITPLLMCVGMGLAYMSAFMVPHPHHVKVAVIGEGPQVTAVAQAIRSKAGDALQVSTLPTTDAAVAQLHTRNLVGAFVPDPAKPRQRLLRIGSYSAAGWSLKRKTALALGTATVVSAIGAALAGPVFHLAHHSLAGVWGLAWLYSASILLIGVGLHPFLKRWTTLVMMVLFVMLNFTSSGGLFQPALQNGFFGGLHAFWNGAGLVEGIRACCTSAGPASRGTPGRSSAGSASGR